MEFHLDPVEGKENNQKIKIENIPIEPDLFLVKVVNDSEDTLTLTREIDQSLIQFYLAWQGEAHFLFSGGHYRLHLLPEKNLLFYNPLKPLPLDIQVAPQARLVFIYITVQRLHQLFVAEAEEISFLSAENINQKFYAETALPPAIQVVLGQFFQGDVSGHAELLLLKAKVYELLARYFNKSEAADVEKCPFLKDEANVERVKKAKAILVERFAQSPTLKELAQEVGLNEYRLKEGFKNIYGKTFFQFLNDYRLDKARHLLDSGQWKVNETAFQIGYANPSHFIGAFRKKFGLTPKKYLQSR